MGAFTQHLGDPFDLGGQPVHLGGHHRKAVAGITGPRRFDAGVDRQQVRRAVHLGNLLEGPVQILQQGGGQVGDRSDVLLDGRAAPFGRLACGTA